MKANCKFIKGEGAPPVTHLPDEEADAGFPAEPERMHELTMKDWMKLFKRWGDQGPPKVSVWKEAVGRRIPRVQCQLRKLEAKDFKEQFARTRTGTSTGPDGWRSKELRLLPEQLLGPLADMMNEIEAGAPWPSSLQYAIIAMLAKAGQDPLKAVALNQRPASVASVIYRAYSSLRYKH